MNNYNKAAVEVLEIVKYLDEDVKKLINQDYLQELEKIKDVNYHYNINKDVPLYDNEFLDETIDILERLLKSE